LLAALLVTFFSKFSPAPFNTFRKPEANDLPPNINTMTKIIKSKVIGIASIGELNQISTSSIAKTIKTIQTHPGIDEL
jgi:hypothetical protein